ncbi:DUF5318 family protein [Actinomadura harenae]|uniref:DUF5318 domain-containing protein n=1 Tax=Actinomadura harenae TaxID=2483351 RepID=A0A3M2MED5_9ACTN|nr:DUF5318 family protein [Actinomadura harenae]RMI47901.1 hypothetical protein EBO15_01040 [Actinomadura harenae]
MCHAVRLTLVRYVYGDEVGRLDGRVAAPAEPAEMARRYGEFRVYVVEVCQSCAWNHLSRSYVLGHGDPPPGR